MGGTTVGELLEALESIPPETEVRLLVQPSWPLRKRLMPMVLEAEGMAWLVEDDGISFEESPYAPGELTAELGWTR